MTTVRTPYTSEYIVAHRDTLNLNEVLQHVKLDEETLVKLVLYANLNTFLVTQKLSLDFVARYIMNPKYHQEDDETTISYGDIQRYQGYSKEQVNKQIALIRQSQ